MSAGYPSIQGLSVSISPSSILLGTSATSTVSITTTSLTPSGTYNITVTGDSVPTGSAPGMVRIASLMVTVNNALPNVECPASSAITNPSGGSYTYVVGYCYQGELLSSTIYPDGTVVTNGYDGLGRNVNVTKSGSSTPIASLVYNQNDQVTKSTLGTGLIENYSYDKLSRPYLITVTNSSSYNLLSLAYKYNVTGTVNHVLGTVMSKPVNETYKFTGKPVSQTTGLYYYGARWYDPSIRRFISPDPKKGHLSDPQTLNLYIYVVDQPTGIIDPTGMDGCGILSGFCNFVSSGASTVYNGTVSFGNDVVNEWNNDPKFRAAVILTLATIAIVATAGVAAPALLPTIAVGIGLGAGISSVAYVGGTLASGGKITASGLFLAASTGAFLGAVGAVAGPVGGSIAKLAGEEATGALARGVTGSLLFGASVDANLASGQTDPKVLAAEGVLSLATAGGSSEFLGEAGISTRGMTTLEQADYFAPGIGAFGTLSSNASAVVANGIVGGGWGAVAELAFKKYLQPQL